MSAQVAPTPAERAVIWHDAECGGYTADLPLWRQLAKTARGAVLDVGAGTGRVALDLAAAGFEVTAADSDKILIDELAARARAAELSIATLVVDVRSLPTGGHFDLVVAPMQLLQLLPTREDRLAALRAVRGCLRSGGRGAFAIVEGEPAAEDDLIPLPDVRELDGWVYSSQPVGAGRIGDEIVIRRIRQWVSPAGELADEENEVYLALMTAEQVESEALECGLRPVARHQVDATDDHVGSTVVELEAS